MSQYLICYSSNNYRRYSSSHTEEQQSQKIPADENLKSSPEQKYQKAVAYWLFIVAGMVFVMVIVGGVTRLTESGLSITEWKPITGVIPPLSLQDWILEFEKYKRTPEFIKLHPDMTLNEFKKIFWMEYAHRLFGRIVGVVFALPFVYFMSKGAIRGSLLAKLLAIFVLGGAQAVLGWFMVKSGLDERNTIPRVSPYRLATHLASAFVIYLGLFWTGLSHLSKVFASETAATATTLSAVKNTALAATPLFRIVTLAVGLLIFLTALSGAFVAGLDAGLVYNTFPLMGDGIVPAEYWELQPPWKNFFENSAAVQFNHRLLAMTTFTSVTALWAWSRKILLPRRVRFATNLLFAVASLQVLLGISTLVYLVPVHLAAMHQAGSLTLLTVVSWLLHELGKVKAVPR